MPRRTALVCLVVSLYLPASSNAISCRMLWYSVDDARLQLRRATEESDLEQAKDQARRVKRALDDSAMGAMDCGCTSAFTAFDEAATNSRRARDADNSEEYVDYLNRSIRRFNAALEELRACAPRRP
jgi:hypothetical protein